MTRVSGRSSQVHCHPSSSVSGQTWDAPKRIAPKRNAGDLAALKIRPTQPPPIIPPPRGRASSRGRAPVRRAAVGRSAAANSPDGVTTSGPVAAGGGLAGTCSALWCVSAAYTAWKEPKDDLPLTPLAPRDSAALSTPRTQQRLTEGGRQRLPLVVVVAVEQEDMETAH